MVKKKLLVSIFFVSMLFFHSYQNCIVDSEQILHKATHLRTNEAENNNFVVFSYKDILFEKYSEYPELENICSFDDFCDGFYRQSEEICDYVFSLISKHDSEYINPESDIGIQNDTQQDNNILEIFSPDADYIMASDIKDSQSTNARFFKRSPTYDAIKKGKIQNGDLILEKKDNNSIGHLAFISNTSHSSDYGDYIQTIESVASGVQYGFLDDKRMIDYQVTIYRVYRATELGVVSRALSFLKKQLGKPYSINYTCTHIGDQPSWYCSELIYAAYYDAGMDILYNPNFDPAKFDYETCPFIPTMMENRFFGGQIIDALNAYYLTLSVSSFQNSKWTIKVYNPNYFPITLEYNSKMCFKGDAIGWKLSSDVKQIALSAGKETSISINENFMATTIAISYCYDGKRYITYADKLDKKELTCNSQIALKEC